MTQDNPGSLPAPSGAPATALAVPAPAGGAFPQSLASRIAWCAAIGLSFLALIAPALWNHYPLLQWDTGGYLARWFEGYLVPSRPGAYGLFLAAGIAQDFWPNIAIQSALTIWIIGCLLKAHAFLRPSALLFTVALLCAVTTLPFLTSILLTDIFAGLSVLALYLLVFRGDAFTRLTRWALTTFAVFSAATHSATFALLAALAAAAFMLRLLDPVRMSIAGLRRAIAVACLGALLTLAANYAVSRQVSWTPGGYGILFGRMLQDGVVKRYLDERCPDTRLKLCPYRAKLPPTADEFLWNSQIFNDLGRFAGLGNEMRIIVLESLTSYPGLQLRLAIKAMLSQLVSLRSGEGVLNSLWHTYGIMETYTPQVVPSMRAARQQQGEFDFTSLNAVHAPTGLLTMALLPLLFWVSRRHAAFEDIQMLAATVMTALLANAFLCGVLANPHDRYGARLIWIVPLVILIAVMRWRAAQTRDMAETVSESR